MQAQRSTSLYFVPSSATRFPTSGSPLRPRLALAHRGNAARFIYFHAAPTLSWIRDRRATLIWGAAFGCASLLIATLLGSRQLDRGPRGPTPAATQPPAATQSAAVMPRPPLADAPGMAGLLAQLVQDGVLQSSSVADAMAQLDRAHFVARGTLREHAYVDAPLSLGQGETISAPHMHATCLELLAPFLHPGARVLDVGSGSGYLAAAMALMVGEEGQVVGIEKHPELTADSVANVRRAAPYLLDSGRLSLSCGNVLAPGTLDTAAAPFNAIHVGAAAPTLPQALVERLAPGGRMVIPVGSQARQQVLMVVDRDEAGRVQAEQLMGVRYVPLTAPGES